MSDPLKDADGPAPFDWRDAERRSAQMFQNGLEKIGNVATDEATEVAQLRAQCAELQRERDEALLAVEQIRMLTRLFFARTKP